MINQNSETWLAIVKVAEYNLDKAEAGLHHRNTDDRDTQYFRGLITAYQTILALKDSEIQVPEIANTAGTT